MALEGRALSGLTHFLESFVAEYGLPALFLSISLEAFGVPLPGESAIVVASTAAAAGRLNIAAVVGTAFAAAVIGDNVGYVIGRKLGRPAILRYGGRVGITDAVLAKTEAVVRKRGPLIVIVARFVVPLRQLNGLVAGTTGMHWMTFLAANVIGAALWVGLWTTLAYRFGISKAILPFLWHHLTLLAAICVPLLILGLVWLRLRRHRA
jgi:membrane protein DedA with SNARE-associated domain